jgi:hypothetical protein
MLIEVFHVVAAEWPVDPEFVTEIQRGQLVAMDVNGTITGAAAHDLPIGIAGDQQSNTTPGTAYSSQLRIGADGAYTRATQNRVADFYNETLASNLITVYQSGGVFRTDVYVATDTFAPGSRLYSADNSHFTTTAGAGAGAIPCGQTLQAPAAYPSGVPGVGTLSADNSMSLGTFLTVKLLV